MHASRLCQLGHLSRLGSLAAELRIVYLGSGMLPTRHLPVILFWVLVAGLSAQPLLIREFGEPYPTVTFPAFGGGGTKHGDPIRTLRASLTVRFADGTDSALTRDALFASVPSSIQVALLHENLGPTRLEPASRRPPSTSVLPGRAAMWNHMRNTAQAQAVRPWLARRLRELYPNAHPVTLTIRWDAIEVWPGRRTTTALVREASLPLHH